MFLKISKPEFRIRKKEIYFLKKGNLPVNKPVC